MIITKDGKKFKAKESFINNSKYLLALKDAVDEGNKSLKVTSLACLTEVKINYEYKTFLDLLNLTNNYVHIKHIYKKYFDFKEILELFYKLDFKLRFFQENLFKNLLAILYHKYHENQITNLQNNLYQKFMKEAIIKIYNINNGYFLNHINDYLSFLFENIEDFNFKFNIFLDHHFQCDEKLYIYIHKYVNNIEDLKIVLYYEPKKIVKYLKADEKILDNLRNFIIIIRSFTDLLFLYTFKNLKYLEIHISYITKEDLVIPEIESLESLNIKNISEEQKIHFSRFKNLKILSLNVRKLSLMKFINFDEIFPSLEILYIDVINLDFNVDKEYLKNISSEIRNLKMIQFCIKNVKNENIIKELEKIPKVNINNDLINHSSKSIFIKFDDINFIINDGRFININEVGENEEIFKRSCFNSLHLRKYLPDNDILEQIYLFSFVEILCLSELVINEGIASNLGKFKYLKELILRNIKFEGNSFSTMLNSLKYTISELDLENIMISEYGIKIIRELKFLTKLKLSFDNLNSEKFIVSHLLNDSFNSFKRLQTFILISNFFRESNAIFLSLKIRSVKLTILNKLKLM